MSIKNKGSRTAVLFGATRGIGRATAIVLDRRGYRVVVVGRDRAAGEGLIATLGDDARFVAADLSSMASIRDAAVALREAAPRVDVVVHSADVLRSVRTDTAEGIEISFATNFVGRVLLNRLLWSSLAAGATIVHVAAAGMPGRLDVSDLPPAADVSAVTAHNLGQRANDAYGLALAEYAGARGIRVVVLHPGMVDTNLRRSIETVPAPIRLLLAVITWLLRPWTVSADAYASRLVAFIERPVEDSRQVLFDRSFRPLTPARRVRDPSFRDAIWRRAHAVAGVSTPDGVDAGAPQYKLDTWV